MPDSQTKLAYKRQAKQFEEMYADEKMTVVRNRIAEIRKAKGIKQNELADLLCVNYTFLYRVEKQTANMSVDLLIATARILNVSIEDLLGVDVPMSLKAKERISQLEYENKMLKEKLAEINKISKV